jgi:hypothetical protein
MSEILLVLTLDGKGFLYFGRVYLHLIGRLVGAELIHVLSAPSERTIIVLL